MNLLDNIYYSSHYPLIIHKITDVHTQVNNLEHNLPINSLFSTSNVFFYCKTKLSNYIDHLPVYRVLSDRTIILIQSITVSQRSTRYNKANNTTYFRMSEFKVILCLVMNERRLKSRYSKTKNTSDHYSIQQPTSKSS